MRLLTWPFELCNAACGIAIALRLYQSAHHLSALIAALH